MITPTGHVKKFTRKLFKKKDENPVKFIVVENSIDPKVITNYLCTSTGRGRILKII